LDAENHGEWGRERREKKKRKGEGGSVGHGPPVIIFSVTRENGRTAAVSLTSGGAGEILRNKEKEGGRRGKGGGLRWKKRTISSVLIPLLFLLGFISLNQYLRLVTKIENGGRRGKKKKEKGGGFCFSIAGLILEVRVAGRKRRKGGGRLIANFSGCSFHCPA